MDISDHRLEIKLPKIKDAGYKVTSPETIDYNCIAWTIGRDDIWILIHDFFGQSILDAIINYLHL